MSWAGSDLSRFSRSVLVEFRSRAFASKRANLLPKERMLTISLADLFGTRKGPFGAGFGTKTGQYLSLIQTFLLTTVSVETFPKVWFRALKLSRSLLISALGWSSSRRVKLNSSFLSLPRSAGDLGVKSTWPLPVPAPLAWCFEPLDCAQFLSHNLCNRKLVWCLRTRKDRSGTWLPLLVNSRHHS